MFETMLAYSFKCKEKLELESVPFVIDTGTLQKQMANNVYLYHPKSLNASSLAEQFY